MSALANETAPIQGAYETGIPVELNSDEFHEIMSITYATLQAHGHRGHTNQGGYLAKKKFGLAAYEHMPTAYPPELMQELSAAVRDRMNSGNEFEDHIGERLRAEADPEQVVVIGEERDANGERTQAGKDRKEEDTWAAYLNPKVRFIFNARMSRRFAELVSDYFGHQVEDPDRVSEPDAIELGPVMGNGLRAMRFVDVKWHKTAAGKSAPKKFDASPLMEPFFGTGEQIELRGALNSDDWMQLAHYYRHGQTLGVVDGDASLWGAVIGKEEVLVWARLDNAIFLRHDPNLGKRRKQSPLELYDRGFAYGLAVVDNAIARELDPNVPSLVFPEWETEHNDHEWGKVALAEAENFGVSGHITLLPGLTPSKALPFYEAGISDIADLAKLDPGCDIAGVKDVAPFVYQARVTLSQKAHLMFDLEWVDLPRADVEVDFDYESDETVYQRGVRVSGVFGDEVVTYDTFTGTDEDEAKVFAAMWKKFGDLQAEAAKAGKSIRFYHYTKYERTQDLRLAKKHAGFPGVPTVEKVEQFYDSDMVCDLYDVYAKQFMWPTMSHSVKNIAKFTGFSWRDKTPGGDLSMVWYRTAVNDPDEEVRIANINRLRMYNEDDTHAQLFTRNWIQNNLADIVPAEQAPTGI